MFLHRIKVVVFSPIIVTDKLFLSPYTVDSAKRVVSSMHRSIKHFQVTFSPPVRFKMKSQPENVRGSRKIFIASIYLATVLFDRAANEISGWLEIYFRVSGRISTVTQI